MRGTGDVTTDLTPYVPRFGLRWHAEAPDDSHRAVDGSLVFADVSGFTALSEKLARTGGKAGAEQMTDVINSLFDDLLRTAAVRGGEMLKYGGDALLLFFSGDAHARRACAAAADMQKRIKEIGRVSAGSAGSVRLRMSVGVHSGAVDFFRVGCSHKEIVVAGPAATECVAMEGAADATEVLVSPATAALLDARNLGAEKAGGRLLRGSPAADVIVPEPEPPHETAALFVPQGVRDYLASGAVAPEHRIATIAFLHLMGLDRELRVQGSEKATLALHDTLCVIQESFEAFGVSFLATDIAPDGTKVMAASGAPAAGEADEEIMLLALRRIVSTGTPLPVRAGVNRGHVFAGDVGPVFRRTYTCIGDVTNTAARVMGRAKGGEVLALLPVLDHTRPGRFGVAEQEPFLAKGKTEPLVPYRVDEVFDVAADPHEDGRPRLPFAGREEELATARAAVEGPGGGLVELIGPVGSGKTRLLEEALAELEDERLVVRCEPYERSTPFFAVRQLLEPLCAGIPLGELVASVAPRLTPWLPLLAAVVDVEMPDTEETAFLDARFRRQRTAAAVDELLQACFAGRRRVIVFEDVHWIDDASAEILGELGRASARKPWLLFVTRRDEPTSYRSPAEAVLLELEPLPDPAVEELIQRAPGRPVPPHVRDALVRRAGGNPLFLTELLSSHRGVGDDEADVPDNLEAVIAAQVDSLPPVDRQLVRCAAVLGSSFTVDLLAEVSGEAWGASDGKTLARRLRAIVVPEGAGRLRFRHQLLRDVAYEGLPYRQRRDLHARACDAIERTLVGEADERVGVLSLHALRAQRYDTCWRWARVAATRAATRHATLEAAEFLERAVVAARFVKPDDAELSETWEELASLADTVGLMARAKEARREARRLTTDPVAEARMCRLEARAAQRDVGLAAAVRWINRGLRALGDAADQRALRERANLLCLLAGRRLEQGRASEALALAQQAVEYAGESGELRARAGAYTILDHAYIAMGRPELATNSQKALELFEQVGDLRQQATLQQHAGARAYFQGRWQEALELYERSRENNTRIGDHVYGGYGTLSIAEILVDQGRLDEAESALLDASQLFDATGFGLGLAYATGYLGRVALRRNDAEHALTLLAHARDRFAEHQLGAEVTVVDAWVAECLLRSGQPEPALSLAEDALVRDGQTGPVSSMLLRVSGYAHAALGSIDAAWAALDESLHVARSRRSIYDVALTLEAFSVLASISGRAWEPEGEQERRELLSQLGVVATPAPPLPVPV